MVYSLFSPLCAIISLCYILQEAALGLKLSETNIGSNIKLFLSSGSNHMEMDAVILRHIQDHISLISLCYESDRPLNFDKVKIEVEYTTEEGIPYIWKIAQISSFQSGYVLQVKNDGIRHNRRECFRVGVSVTGKMKMLGRGEKSVMVRDVSLTGFSITDRKKDLNLDIGNEVSLHFEDLGHILNLSGKVVRSEEHEDMVIYGFTIHNLCKDLPSYINTKQSHRK